MQIERQIQTTFRWWTSNNSQVISPEHADRLEMYALERIHEMQQEGYFSGELLVEIDDVQYRGWWDVAARTL